jgi:hypothetical protein
VIGADAKSLQSMVLLELFVMSSVAWLAGYLLALFAVPIVLSAVGFMEFRTGDFDVNPTLSVGSTIFTAVTTLGLAMLFGRSRARDFISLEIEEGVEYPQEEVAFILRSAGNSKPALQLISGVVTISGLVIRDFLQSITYNDPEKAGWQFNVEDGTFRIKNAAQETILASGGTEGLEDPNFILTIIKDKIAEIEKANKEAKDDAKAASDAAGGAQGTANTADDTASTAKSRVDILKEDLDATFTRSPGSRAGYTFTNDFKDFFTNDNDLKDFAFLEKITPANVSTYIANASIKQATIAALAVGRAQIKNLAVSTAKIAEAAVKTLQIGEDSVVVAKAFPGRGGKASSSAVVAATGGLNPLGGRIFASVSLSASARDNGLTVSLSFSSGGGATARVSANDNSSSGEGSIEAPCSVSAVSGSSEIGVIAYVTVSGNGATYSNVLLSMSAYRR